MFLHSAISHYLLSLTLLDSEAVVMPALIWSKGIGAGYANHILIRASGVVGPLQCAGSLGPGYGEVISSLFNGQSA